jgi:hypothetical protein
MVDDINIWQSSRHIELLSMWRDDRLLLFFLSCCSVTCLKKFCCVIIHYTEPTSPLLVAMSTTNPTVLDKSSAPVPQGGVGDHIPARGRKCKSPAPAPQARDRKSLAPAPQGGGGPSPGTHAIANRKPLHLTGGWGTISRRTVANRQPLHLRVGWGIISWRALANQKPLHLRVESGGPSPGTRSRIATPCTSGGGAVSPLLNLEMQHDGRSAENRMKRV